MISYCVDMQRFNDQLQIERAASTVDEEGNLYRLIMSIEFC
jgi:hypothetical protein